jgi:hypothetical protein
VAVDVVNAPGCARRGLTVTTNVLAVLGPQALLAVTLIVPVEPAVAVIEFVVDVPTQPAGRVHVYVRPATSVTLYVWDDPWQNPEVLPVIVDGMFGTVFTVKAIVLAMLVPQLVVAVTDNVPEVAVAEKLTETEFVVPVIVAPLPE